MATPLEGLAVTSPAELCRKLEEADPVERRRRRRELRARIKAAETDLCHAVRRLQPGGWPFPDKPDFTKLNAEADAARARLAELRRELRGVELGSTSSSRA